MSLKIKEPRESVTYLGILRGNLVSGAKEDTPNAQKIEYEDAEGNPLSKLCVVYENLNGYLTGAEFKKGKFTEQLVLKVLSGEDKVELYVSVKSRFFEEIGKVLPNLDLTKEFVAVTHDFIDQEKGKRVVKFIAEQEDDKGKMQRVYGAYYDHEKGETIGGFPVMEGDWADETDRTIYNANVVKFLKKKILAMKFPKLSLSEKPKVDTSADDVDGLPF